MCTTSNQLSLFVSAHSVKETPGQREPAVRASAAIASAQAREIASRAVGSASSVVFQADIIAASASLAAPRSGGGSSAMHRA